MLAEVEDDIDNNILFYSERFNENGINNYSALLKDAIVKHNTDWLAEQFLHNDSFKTK